MPNYCLKLCQASSFFWKHYEIETRVELKLVTIQNRIFNMISWFELDSASPGLLKEEPCQELPRFILESSNFGQVVEKVDKRCGTDPSPFKFRLLVLYLNLNCDMLPFYRFICAWLHILTTTFMVASFINQFMKNVMS